MKKYKKIVKTTITYFLAKTSYRSYTSIPIGKLRIYNLPNKNISLKEIKFINKIYAKLLHNIPRIFSKKPNFKILLENGIDTSIPIFLMNPITPKICKCIEELKKYISFNVVVFYGDFLQSKLLEKTAKKAQIIFADKSNNELFYSINILNINNNTVIRNKGNEDIENCFCLCDKNVPFKIYDKIIDNENVIIYENTNFLIEIKQYNFYNKIILFNIFNKNNKINKLTIKYTKELNNNKLNYYKLKYIKKCLTIEDIRNSDIFSLYSNKIIPHKNIIYKLNNSNNYLIKINKKIIINKMESIYFIETINQKIENINLEEIINLYKSKIKEIVNIKIQTSDAFLNNLINFELPSKLTLDQTSIQPIEQSYEENLNNYKIGKLSAREFFVWLKETFFGIQIQKDRLSFTPIFCNDFNIELTYNQKKIKIKVLQNLAKKFVEIDGVRYVNLSNVPLLCLTKDCYITLVI